MSGGVFCYPHTKDITDFLEDDSDLRGLCEFCEQEGYANIAKQTRAFLNRLDEIKDQLLLMDHCLGDYFNDTFSLRYAWKTCDFRGDMSESDIGKADQKQSGHIIFED